MDALELVQRALRAVEGWEAEWGPYDAHPAADVAAARLEEALAEYTERLRGNYPFFHPRYAGQMLKPPHPVALAAYAAAQRINPNNHALDGGPPTGQMEKEVVADLAALFGFPPTALGHLTGGGTMANLEALWVARHLHPDKAIAFSADAHYTHGRMAEVLQLPTAVVATNGEGQMDLEALENVLRTGGVGTVVATPGTTGLGAVDPVEDIIALARRYGVRVHADAAYGGFFALVATSAEPPTGFPVASFRALAECDSLVVDPHKHGLQPYGCGCILFRDPSVGRFYRHDSPYTYFTSDALHLGEISLECSRPGAAAGALWMTLRALPLHPEDGLGPILSAGLRAARDWARRIEASAVLDLYAEPQLDILAFLPRTEERTASAVDAASQSLFERAMNDPQDPIFLSVYRVATNTLLRRYPDLEGDIPQVRILRSVLMKPEHELYVGRLHERVETLAAV
jgi:glutamate/tyrosine decarboxylase-like PLP-dependent enzyme